MPGSASPTASPPRRRPTSASSATPAWRSGSPSGCARWTPTTSAPCPRPAGRSAGRSSSSPSRRPWRPPSGRRTTGWAGATRAPAPPALEAAVRAAYDRLAGDDAGASFAVRSSATAEDLPDASFAGQQETFLNVTGIDEVLHRMRPVVASLYNDRAISYRVHKGYGHNDVALSAGVQRMVRSDLGSAGVMFTMDTESGFTDVVFITSSY